MKTISATLEPDADGTLHLPLPPELRHGRLHVMATVEPVATDSSEESEVRRKLELQEVLEQIRARNPFKNIEDPVAWQREMRKDRPMSR